MHHLQSFTIYASFRGFFSVLMLYHLSQILIQNKQMHFCYFRELNYRAELSYVTVTVKVGFSALRHSI